MRMLLAVAATAVLAGVAPAKVEITDVKASHGHLGPERKGTVYVQGDEVFYRFVVRGSKADADGRLSGELSIAVTDAGGKAVYENAFPVRQIPALGAESIPAYAVFTLGEGFNPGEYELRVEYKDVLAGESATFKRKFTCKPTEFALAAVRFYQDGDNRVPAPVGGVVSQTLFVRLRAIGFDHSKDRIDVVLSIQVLDAQRKPVMPRPIKATVHSEKPEVVRSATHVNLSGELVLNRPGEFILVIAVTDTVGGKTEKFEAPLIVRAP